MRYEGEFDPYFLLRIILLCASDVKFSFQSCEIAFSLILYKCKIVDGKIENLLDIQSHVR